MKKFFIPLAFFAFILSSCSKSKDCELNSASLAGSYKMTSLKYKTSPTSAEIDVLASFSACEKDDIYVFNSNNTFTYQDAGVSCSPSGTFNSTWSLSGNILTYDSDNYTVAAFSCSGMTATFSNYSTSGDLLTATFVRL